MDEENEINHVLILTYAPFANGISEKINNTILEILKMNKNRSIIIIIIYIKE